jgi:hypothetical protein
VESGTCRSHRDAEDVGDLGQGLARVVLEDEDCPLLGRQAAEAALELVAIGDRPVLVGCWRDVGVLRQQLDRRAAATLATGLGDTGSHNQPVAPSVESLRIAQPWQFVPDRDQRLLDGVLGEVVIAEDPVGNGEQASADEPGEGIEGLSLAAPCAFHQVSLHRVISVDGGRKGTAREV